ncbi:ubiquitin-associated domain-containing protein 1 [Glossina fuscipes]|uniref:Ubiquitin-associated domain-containing protein 1 n=2 Tax=Nemorhina TaxID=44051 RepID=A0A9C5YYQ2_9MUSC|nr:ubiquitin-associated domain-containing protein 1 [Glossina fuscipes]KAI9583674.1 hypothetical protein GQX74_005422 [Glossina fuscipes]
MMLWMREKFAERRAKWLAARKKSHPSEDGEETATETSSSSSSPRRNIDQSKSCIIPCASVPPSDISQHHINSTSCNPANTATINSSTRLPVLKNARRSSASSNLDAAVSSEEIVRGPAVKEPIKVRIICPSARVLAFQTETTKRLMDLKNEVILELADDLASIPLFAPDVRTLGPRFRLVKADYQGVELSEQQTLSQLNITNNELLVLVFKHNNLQQIITQTRETRSAPDVEIEAATRSVPARQGDLPMVDLNEIFQQSNLQFDVRKVLISLAQASAAIIGSGPYANRLIAMLKQKLINKRNYQNDTLQCLVDMGFKKERAEYALKIHNNVYSTALEWLIQRQSEDSKVEDAVMGLPKSTSICSPSTIISNDSPVENVAALLEIVRIYSHREIPPTADSIQNLVEMGFHEPDVILALKKTCNNKAAACEWLCGNRTGSLVELREGLSEDSPVLKSILELPQVQLSLGNPKVFLAFLAILENEHSLRVWGGNDTSSVITQILQKYHEEKHVMGINQFYSSR